MDIKEVVSNILPDFSQSKLDLASLFKKHDPDDHRKKALQLEEKVLALSGLKTGKDISIYDVPITHEGHQFIHTIECGKKNQDILILLHGYSGSLVLFYPLLKPLSEKYNVFCIDFLGMGLSSRPEFKCSNAEETIQYFVDTFEKWRKVMNIKKYYLGGHSFGGYIAALCAYKNRKGLKGLYLLSPIGVSGEEEKVSEEWSQALGWTKTNFWLAYFKTYSKLYDEKITPNGLVRTFSPIARAFIQEYITHLLGDQGSKEEGKLVGDFLYEMLLIPGGSEQAIHSLIKPPRVNAHFPLEKIVFNEIGDIPVYCYYGTEDWNDWTDAKKHAEKPESKNFVFEFIPNSGHQVIFQNPEQVVENMLSNLEKNR